MSAVVELPHSVIMLDLPAPLWVSKFGHGSMLILERNSVVSSLTPMKMP